MAKHLPHGNFEDDDGADLPIGPLEDKDRTGWPPVAPSEPAPSLEEGYENFAYRGLDGMWLPAANKQPSLREYLESKKRRPMAPTCDPRATGTDEKCGGWIGPNYTPRTDEEIQKDPQPRDAYELDEIVRLMTPDERRRYEQWWAAQEGRPHDPDNSTNVEFNQLIDAARERWLDQKYKGY